MDAKIKNRALLARTPLRADALAVAEAGLQAIDTKQAIRNSVSLTGSHFCVGASTCSLAEVDRFFLVGVGKCSIEAAEALEEILGDRVAGGIILDVKVPERCSIKRVACYEGTHPMPTEKNVEITRKIVDTLKDLTERDLVVVIVSGGGSTLLCLPDEGATCIEERLILETLFKKGATIQEINTVRKHTSLARGGQLAKYAFPAQVVSLIFSDVPGDDISFVASGPTVRDDTTIADADAILSKYGILQACGLEHCGLVETPKDEKYFRSVQNVIVVSNAIALHAMAEEAKRRGYAPSIRDTAFQGESRVYAERVAQELHSAPAGAAYLYGGESTVRVEGSGKGGRNREFALAALPLMQHDELILSIASDGRDNGDRAGAIADVMGRDAAERLELRAEQYLADNNSEDFFEKNGDAIHTDDTGSNVSDLVIALKALPA